jgi:hypothetical protein
MCNLYWTNKRAASFMLGLLFSPEDGTGMFLRDVGWISADYMAL